MNTKRGNAGALVAAGAVALSCWQTIAVAGDPVPVNLFAVQTRISTANFQLFLDLADDGSIALTSPLFSPPDGVYGADFVGDVLHGTILDNTNLTDYFLVTINHAGPQRATGARVSASSIGAPNVEALAAIDDTIYVTSLNTAAHRTTLTTVDPVTGIGTPIGQASRNVMIKGLAYDPLAGMLYGAGVPFGAGETNAVDDNNLYTLDPATGAETLVGQLGTRIESLTWDAELGLVGSFDHLYTIDSTTGAATQLGTTDFTDGMPGSSNGIWALAALVPDDIGPPDGVCGDPVDPPTVGTGPLSGAVTATDALFVLGAAISAQVCELCVCDVDDSGGIAATDALIVLRVAVGENLELTCPAC